MVDDLPKGELFRAVKDLVDLNEVPHLHLPQHKLFTLTSVALQYLMYYSGQNPGSYILRIEDSLLYEKLVKRSKDPTTRKFLRALFLPRKIKYKESLFFLDYFHVGTWQKTNEIPKDRIVDGVDLSATLFEGNESPRKEMFYYRGTELFAVRLGDYKANFITQGVYGQFGEREEHATPILYNLSEDPGEQFDIAAEHPEILGQINELVTQHQSKLVRGKDQLVDRE